jgi:hypothetical protein
VDAWLKSGLKSLLNDIRDISFVGCAWKRKQLRTTAIFRLRFGANDERERHEECHFFVGIHNKPSLGRRSLDGSRFVQRWRRDGFFITSLRPLIDSAICHTKTGTCIYLFPLNQSSPPFPTCLSDESRLRTFSRSGWRRGRDIKDRSRWIQRTLARASILSFPRFGCDGRHITWNTKMVSVIRGCDIKFCDLVCEQIRSMNRFYLT